MTISYEEFRDIQFEEIAIKRHNWHVPIRATMLFVLNRRYFADLQPHLLCYAPVYGGVQAFADWVQACEEIPVAKS